MLDHPDVKRFLDQFLPWVRAQWPQWMSIPIRMGPSLTDTVPDPMVYANIMSRGHCDQVCVTTLVNKITGLKNAIFHRPNQVSILWCDKEPRLEIYIRWFVDFQADVEIRGLHAQSKIRLKKNSLINGHMEGSLVVQLPWTQTLNLGHPTLVLQGSPLWSLDVPESLISESALRKLTHASLDASLQEASAQMVHAWTALQEAFERDYPKTDWTVGIAIERSTKNFMTCNSHEKPKMPLDGCDPCDTCCKCFIEKKCTDECKQCECLHCDEKRWAQQMPLMTAVFVSIVFCVYLYIINQM